MSAWDEDEGIPNHQVTRFQMIAAIKVAITISTPLSSVEGSATLPPIVFATPVKDKAPMKFIVAASRIACRGLSARVETDVAMAFAVS
ncbi:hypothetical protein D3C71_1650660 [compost metagenome]